MKHKQPESSRISAKLVAGVGAIAAVLAGGRGGADAPKTNATTRPDAPGSAAYRSAVQKTAQMISDPTAQRMARQHGLDILNLTWEDTGRYKGSSVGPNISDMTIQVATRNPQTRQLEVTAMPVIRYPNFSDITCDIDPRDFTLLVGNQASGGSEILRRVSLYEFLQEPTAFLTIRPRGTAAKRKACSRPNVTARRWYPRRRVFCRFPGRARLRSTRSCSTTRVTPKIPPC